MTNSTLGGWLSWLEHCPDGQDCGFDPQSGHIEDSPSEYVNQWNNKAVSLLHFPLLCPVCLKSIKKIVLKCGQQLITSGDKSFGGFSCSLDLCESDGFLGAAIASSQDMEQ